MMLRGLTAVVVLLGLTVLYAPAEGLGVGDVAPKLTVKEFVKGEAVKEFEKGKIYVIEFWVTWCKPCVFIHAHLTELQKKYKDVIFLGVNVAEPDQQKVKPFVKKVGGLMDYRLAMDWVPEGKGYEEGKMWKNWIIAGGAKDIMPAVFIIKDGKIAWIGHAQNMDKPFEQIYSKVTDEGLKELKGLKRLRESQIVTDDSTDDSAGQTPNSKLRDLYLLGIATEEVWDFLPLGIERVFREQSKAFYNHMHSRVLLSKESTREEFMKGLAWLRRHATAKDLVVIFIGCHGNCIASGESVFQTRNGMVRPREIKKVLAQLPCQVLFVDDACHAGNWPKEFPGDPMPPNVTALCCCLSTQISSFEFDITLFEALYGRADFNKDGVVDLDEVIKYCGLRIKEVQGGRLTPVFHKAKNLKGTLPLTKASPHLVGVVHGGELWSALLGRQEGDHYYVRIIGAAMHPGPTFVTDKVSRDALFLPGDGPALMVKRKDGWRPARLVSQDGDRYKVRYVGETKGEEIVDGKRVRHLFAGKPGEVFPLNPPAAGAAATAPGIRIIQALQAQALRPGPFLGIRGEDSDGKFIVKEVIEGSSAAKAGLQAGDVIVAFGGKKISSVAELTAAILERKVGEKVTVEVLRDKQTMKLEATLGKRPSN